jgi:hypothetical protein
MARSPITVTNLTAYNSESAITKDAIDATNEHSIDVSSLDDGKLAIYIETTSTDAMTFEIKAGDFSDASLGDITISTAAVALNVIQVESARVKDSDGLILIDVTGTGTGNIFAVNNVSAA